MKQKNSGSENAETTDSWKQGWLWHRGCPCTHAPLLLSLLRVWLAGSVRERWSD